MGDSGIDTANIIAKRVSDFYESHSYPPAVDDVDAYRGAWDDSRRRAESHLFWPSASYCEDRTILVAGCGTAQAAHYAVRWPRARVVGIDVSARALSFSAELRRRHTLSNLELHELPIEHASVLKQGFDHIVCTGVLHHLPDPDAGLRALRGVLKDSGALHVMVYAPYGRAGVYMLQEYCRRLGIGGTDAEIRDLAVTLKALPKDHPIATLLRTSPDFETTAGLADALLHPQDRAFSVPQLLDFLRRTDMTFGRWVRQAPYLPWCGALALTPHKTKLTAMPAEAQYAALELFRGTMVRHSFVAYGTASIAQRQAIDFAGDAWLSYIPVRLPDTVIVREKLPSGAAAVLINRNHTYTDLYLPIDAQQERLFARIDGERTIADLCNEPHDRVRARSYFQELWRWDQVVFDTSKVAAKG